MKTKLLHQVSLDMNEEKTSGWKKIVKYGIKRRLGDPSDSEWVTEDEMTTGSGK